VIVGWEDGATVGKGEGMKLPTVQVSFVGLLDGKGVGSEEGNGLSTVGRKVGTNVGPNSVLQLPSDNLISENVTSLLVRHLFLI
jgi:hypothetical protein